MPVIRTPGNDQPPPIDVHQALAQEQNRRCLELIADEKARAGRWAHEAPEPPKKYTPLVELANERADAARAQVSEQIAAACEELKIAPSVAKMLLLESRFTVSNDGAVYVSVSSFRDGAVVSDSMPLAEGVRLLLDPSRSPELQIEAERSAYKAKIAAEKEEARKRQGLYEARKRWVEEQKSRRVWLTGLPRPAQVALVLRHEFADQSKATVFQMAERMAGLFLETPEQADQTIRDLIDAMVRPINERDDGFDVEDGFASIIEPNQK